MQAIDGGKRPEQIRELGQEAQALLNSKAFQEALLRLRKQWFAELMAVPEYHLTARTLHAKLQALEAIPLELLAIVNDATMQKKRA
jgi:hypothetical protein